MRDQGNSWTSWLRSQRETFLGRAVMWYGGSMVALVGVMAVVDVISLRVCAVPVPPWISRGMVLVLPVTTAIFAVWSWRVMKRVKACKWRVCKHCGYDLRESEESRPCPECGKSFEFKELEKYWTNGPG